METPKSQRRSGSLNQIRRKSGPDEISEGDSHDKHNRSLGGADGSRVEHRALSLIIKCLFYLSEAASTRIIERLRIWQKSVALHKMEFGGIPHNENDMLWWLLRTSKRIGLGCLVHSLHHIMLVKLIMRIRLWRDRAILDDRYTGLNPWYQSINNGINKCGRDKRNQAKGCFQLRGAVTAILHWRRRISFAFLSIKLAFLSAKSLASHLDASYRVGFSMLSEWFKRHLAGSAGSLLRYWRYRLEAEARESRIQEVEEELHMRRILEDQFQKGKASQLESYVRFALNWHLRHIFGGPELLNWKDGTRRNTEVHVCSSSYDEIKVSLFHDMTL